MRKRISEYEVKELTVADFVNHTDNKNTIIRIIDGIGSVLFEEKLEELVISKEGATNELCDRVVENFKLEGGIGFNDRIFGIIEIYV